MFGCNFTLMFNVFAILKSDVTLTINVLDQNNNRPTFSSLTFTSSVSEVSAALKSYHIHMSQILLIMNKFSGFGIKAVVSLGIMFHTNNCD